MQNAIPVPEDIATRIARRTLAQRGADYAEEVRRLLDAGREVMARCGTASRPRVADIIAAAGLSNDAFYRHFSSKDALVEAILEDGTARLRSYLAHQMAKEATPERQIRRWVEGVLAQGADPDIASATLAVMWNGGSVGGSGSASLSASASLGSLLSEPLAALGVARAELHALLLAHAVEGWLADHLWQQVPPTSDDIDQITAFCLRK